MFLDKSLPVLIYKNTFRTIFLFIPGFTVHTYLHLQTPIQIHVTHIPTRNLYICIRTQIGQKTCILSRLYLPQTFLLPNVRNFVCSYESTSNRWPLFVSSLSMFLLYVYVFYFKLYAFCFWLILFLIFYCIFIISSKKP